MGVASFPASGGGLSSVVKSVQTGSTSTSGTVTITAVNTAKALVTSFSTGSSGYVAATGSINAAYGSNSGISFSNFSGYAGGYSAGAGSSPNISPSGPSSYYPGGNTVQGRYLPAATNYSNLGADSSSIYMNMGAMNTNGANISLNSTSLTGGSTSLTSATYGAYLTNSTTLTVTGPCQYQVVEYY